MAREGQHIEVRSVVDNHHCQSAEIFSRFTMSFFLTNGFVNRAEVKNRTEINLKEYIIYYFDFMFNYLIINKINSSIGS